MPQRVHPFGRGLLLAAVTAALTILAGTRSLTGLFRWDGFPNDEHVLAGGVVLGAAIASLPGRLRRRRGPRQRSTSKGCILAFAGGLGMMLALSLAGLGSLEWLTGAMQGGLGALAFAGTAWLTAFPAARLIGRRCP